MQKGTNVGWHAAASAFNRVDLQRTDEWIDAPGAEEENITPGGIRTPNLWLRREPRLDAEKPRKPRQKPSLRTS